jgi:hypothetical protein
MIHLDVCNGDGSVSVVSGRPRGEKLAVEAGGPDDERHIAGGCRGPLIRHVASDDPRADPAAVAAVAG